VRRLAALATIAIAAALMASSADAWHALDAQAAATCNPQTGLFDVSATILQSTDWPGAFVKSVSPPTLSGSGTRTITIVIGWAATAETQTFTRTVSLSGSCVVVCVPQVVEKIVYVDRPTEVVREVVREVPVERIVEKIVYVPKVVYKIKYKTRWKTRTVVKHVYHTKVVHDRCPPPPVCCEGKG
jgi:hypothetical protein